MLFIYEKVDRELYLAKEQKLLVYSPLKLLKS